MHSRSPATSAKQRPRRGRSSRRLTAIENRRGEFALILAGYPTERTTFLESNPGLDSRFDGTIHFRNYATDEMVKIFRRRALKGDYALGAGFAERLATVIIALDRDRPFANGRTVRRLFHRLRACQERRLLNTPEPTTPEARRGLQFSAQRCCNVPPRLSAVLGIGVL